MGSEYWTGTDGLSQRRASLNWLHTVLITVQAKNASIFDVTHRPPERDQSRKEYDSEVCNLLNQAYNVARDYLQLAHERRKDYYDSRTLGKRFKQGELV